MRQEFRHSSAGYFCSEWDQLGSLTQPCSSGPGWAGGSRKALLAWLMPQASSMGPLSFLMLTWASSPHGGLRVVRLLIWWWLAPRGKHSRWQRQELQISRGPASAVTQPHFHSTRLVKTSRRTSKFQREGKKTLPFHGEKGKTFAAIFNLPHSGEPSQTSSLKPRTPLQSLLGSQISVS